MIRTESRIIVAANIGDVWGYLCDVGRWPEWAPTVVDCRVRGGGGSARVAGSTSAPGTPDGGTGGSSG